MTSRIQFPEIQGIDELFTESYLNYLTHLHDKFSDQIKILRKERINQLKTLIMIFPGDKHGDQLYTKAIKI